jgi:benzoyl-CoA-dihydrodiol lyase
VMTYDIGPAAYRHWVLTIEPPVATLALAPGGGADPGGSPAALPGVDIELADAVERLRFEHPDVAVVVVTGRTGDAFIAGIPAVDPAAPPALARQARAFRAEVRRAVEDASAHSGQRWLTALNGPAAGPGYELALATDEIILVDDGQSGLSLDGVETAGDRVSPDVVAACGRGGGVSGRQALELGLVDALVPEPGFAEFVAGRARAVAAARHCGPVEEAVELGPLWREDFDTGFAYPNVRAEIDGAAGVAAVTISGPANHECFAPEPGPRRLRSHWWPLAVARELDETLLAVRSLAPGIGTLVLRTEGDALAVASADVAMTSADEDAWFVRQVVLSWKRTLERLDNSWQSVIAVVEPGSCFVGTLLELVLAADEAYMPAGPGATMFLTEMNFGMLPRAGGRSRLESRLRGGSPPVAGLAARVGDAISTAEAAGWGLVTAVPESGWVETVQRALQRRDQPASVTRRYS